MTALATAFVTITPDLVDFRTDVNQGVDKADLPATGKKAGKKLGDGLKDGLGKSDLGGEGKTQGKKFGDGFTDGVEGGTDKARQSMSEFADSVGSKAGAAGLLAGTALGAGIVGGLNKEKVNDKLAAQLGATAQMSGELGKVAGDLYGKAYGDGLGQVNDAIRGVIQAGLVMGDASNEQLESITANVLDLADTFEQDLGAVTKAVGQELKTGLAPSAEVAFDVMTRGFQQGADRAGDFLDTITEYSTQFRKFGLDAATATGILVQGMQAGARDSDIVADAIKEFSIRAVDGSKLTAEGFKAVGLNAAEMTAQIGQGGPTAAAALDLTLDRLRAMPDPVARAQAAVALFGTQAEDLGDALFALDPSAAAAGLGEIGGAAERMGATLAGNPATNLESFKRQLTSTFVDVVGGVVLPAVTVAAAALATQFGPAVQAATRFVQENQAWLVPLAVVLGTMTGTLLVLVGAMKAWAAIQAAVIAGQLLLNTVMNANPIGIIIVAIAGLVAGLIYAYQHSETFRNIVQAAFDGVKTAASVAWAIIKPIFDAYVFYITQIIAPVVLWLWNHIVKPYFELIGAEIKLVMTVVRIAFEIFVAFLRNVVAPVILWLWVNVVKPYFEGIAATIRAVWDIVRPILEALGTFIRDKVAPSFKAGVDAIGNAWDTLKEKARAPVAFVVTMVINPLIRGFNKVAGALGATTRVDEIGGFAAGGLIGGIGGPTSDSNLARVSRGEYVLPTWFVNQVGVPVLNWLIGQPRTAGRRAGDGSEGMAFALGGLVDWAGDAWDLLTDPTRLLRGPAEALLRQVPGGGMVREFAVGMGRKLIDGVMGWLTGPAAGGGGNVGAARSFATGQAGKPYVWGGVGPGGFDCSGLVSAVTRVYRGQLPPWVRLFTTATAESAFKPGRGVFTVGWSHAGERGGGSVGHTAANIAGFGFEATPPRVRIGSAATPISAFAHVGHADRGAVVVPGLNLVANATGRSEVVSPDDGIRVHRWSVADLAHAIGVEVAAAVAPLATLRPVSLTADALGPGVVP